jgi:hypothetical protein
MVAALNSIIEEYRPLLATQYIQTGIQLKL